MVFSFFIFSFNDSKDSFFNLSSKSDLAFSMSSSEIIFASSLPPAPLKSLRAFA